MKTDISKIINEHDNVQFAYLFGSYADGTHNENSDIDIAVYLNDTSLDARLSLQHFLEKACKKDIDLVVLNTIKNIYLLETILCQGIVIKDADSRAMYEVRKNHEIIDFKDFKRYIDAA